MVTTLGCLKILESNIFVLYTVMFDEERLSYEKFQLDPLSYFTNEKLVIKINRKYYTWKQAQPLLFSLLLFKRPLPEVFLVHDVK